MSYSSHSEYLKWLTKLLNNYNIDTKDLSAISLVGFNTHVLADLHDTTEFAMKESIKEGHVITANKLDSLYKHAREVDIFPTLSIPSKADFILVINAEDFDRVASRTDKYKSYIIHKTNYITVGEFIYSLDYDIEIIIENKDDPSEITYMTAKYIVDEDLPNVLRDIVNPTIKLVKRKTIRGWEYHLYITLKQYAREVYEREFQDRDYSTFSYTANAELVDVVCYREKSKIQPGESGLDRLGVKLYFENSRTSEDSIFMQFDSPNTFTLIHKSQENGFRPLSADKLITYVYTTSGKYGNFRYAHTQSEYIKFVNDIDTDLEVQVSFIGQESSGGVSYVDDRETLRKDIITKRSTRDSIMTENDLYMQVNKASRYNKHYVIKNRNDIIRLFHVYTTLKYHQSDSESFVIPTNTLDVTWRLNESASWTRADNGDNWYNATSFIVKCTEPGKGEIIHPADAKEELLLPLMEEFRLGITTPVYNTEGTAIIIDDETIIPTIHPDTDIIVQGQRYFYKNRLYEALITRNELKEGDALKLISQNTGELVDEEDATFKPVEGLYYWLPYFMTYVKSPDKNYIKLYNQTHDQKYDLDYNISDKDHPYHFICNWVRFQKTSIYNEYVINMNLRSNLTNFTLVDSGFLYKLPDGTILDTNKIQVYILLTDKKTGNVVFFDKFGIENYESIPSGDDDYINYTATVIPSGITPSIVNDTIALESSLTDEWMMVGINDLKCEIKVYDVDSDVDTIDTDNIKGYTDENGEFVEVKVYKDVDFRSDRFLVNTYTADVDILQDLTEVFKEQHSVITPSELKLHQIPLVQYTYYKFYPDRYHEAMKEEMKVLEHVHRFQGEFSMSLKFTNSYGYSRYYTIGRNKKPLNNVQIDMEFSIKPNNGVDIDTDAIAAVIASYIEDIDFVNFEDFHVSRLNKHLFDVFSGSMNYIEFQSLAGKLTDNQLMEMKINRLANDTVIENINIPYVVENGRFKYVVNWNIFKSDVQ